MKQIDQSEFMASQQLKKLIPQLLLSVSLFSFVFSYSSFPPKLHYYFSANSFQILTYALDKNCLFLICNGLLVFLAKTSGLIRPPPPSHDLDDALQKRIGDTLQSALEKYVLEEVTRETKEDEEKLKDLEDEEKLKIKHESGEERTDLEVSIFIAESEEEGGGGAIELEDDEEKNEDQAETRNFWLFEDDDEQQLYGDEVEEEDYEDDEEREEMSTEELNQKFEDFIRRMKEEIIINEARQKAVVVK